MPGAAVASESGTSEQASQASDAAPTVPARGDDGPDDSVAVGVATLPQACFQQDILYRLKGGPGPAVCPEDMLECKFLKVLCQVREQFKTSTSTFSRWGSGNDPPDADDDGDEDEEQPSSAGSTPRTSALRSILRRRAREGERPKTSIGSVRIEE